MSVKRAFGPELVVDRDEADRLRPRDEGGPRGRWRAPERAHGPRGRLSGIVEYRSRLRFAADPRS